MQKLVLWKTNLTATPPLFPCKEKNKNKKTELKFKDAIAMSKYQNTDNNRIEK